MGGYGGQVSYSQCMTIINNKSYLRCGICGDAYDANPRQHEAPNGMYANGIITRGYTPGQEITVTAHITANHVVSGINIKLLELLIN